MEVVVLGDKTDRIAHLPEPREPINRIGCSNVIPPERPLLVLMERFECPSYFLFCAQITTIYNAESHAQKEIK